MPARDATQRSNRWTALGAVGWWLLGAAVWLVMAATLARPDVIAAVAAGAVVLGVVSLTRSLGLIDFHVRLRWLRHGPRLVLQVLRDLWMLTQVLVRPRREPGVFRAIPFDGGGNTPDDVGRRALLTLAASLGPNTFVVGFDRSEGLLLVHQLVPNENVLPLPGGRYPLR